jgi:hypothetical protein
LATVHAAKIARNIRATAVGMVFAIGKVTQ